MSKPMQAGLIGFGNIGAGLLRSLETHGGLIASRLPRPIRIKRIADLDILTKRDAPYEASQLTTDANQLIEDPEIEVVIELIGGYEPARTFVERALTAGKHVVTANKAMLAEHGAPLMELAARKGVALLYEAAVGGGIPIIRALQQGLSANRIRSVQGIINGTANYILTQMDQRGVPFLQALAEAQEAGYAEPDPTFDIEGHDTAHKIAVLASLAFGMDLRFGDVWREGITAIQPIDLNYARELGYAVKLLGIAELDDEGAANVRVHPTLIPRTSQLASVNGVFNAIWVDGSPIGSTMYYGRGAGADATSSAVLSDLMALAAQPKAGAGGGFNRYMDGRLAIPIGEKKLKPHNELQTHFYLRFTVVDRPGVMAKLSAALAQHEISIESMIQHKVEPQKGAATITIVTHMVREGAMHQCLGDIASTEVNLAPPLVLRVQE